MICSKALSYQLFSSFFAGSAHPGYEPSPDALLGMSRRHKTVLVAHSGEKLKADS